MRNDEIWDLLRDPTLPPLDRQMLDEEIDEIDNQVMELERRLRGMDIVYWLDDDDETLTISSCESESIGLDEYEREGLIANEDFDLANEV